MCVYNLKVLKIFFDISEKALKSQRDDILNQTQQTFNAMSQNFNEQIWNQSQTIKEHGEQILNQSQTIKELQKKIQSHENNNTGTLQLKLLRLVTA